MLADSSCAKGSVADTNSSHATLVWDHDCVCRGHCDGDGDMMMEMVMDGDGDGDMMMEMVMVMVI